MVDAGLDAVIVNPTAIFGPIDVGPSRVNRVLRLAARGRVPFVVGGGFDFVDVRDVVVGLVAATRHGRTGESYLLGGHRETALGLARRATRTAGHRGPRWAIPLRLVAPFAPLGERVGRMFGSDSFTKASVSTLAEDPIVDVSKAARELAYVPRSLDDTIEDLVRSFGHSVPRPRTLEWRPVASDLSFKALNAMHRGVLRLTGGRVRLARAPDAHAGADDRRA